MPKSSRVIDKSRDPGYLLARSRRLRVLMAEAFFNVMHLGTDYNAIVYYDSSQDKVEMKLIDSQTSIEVKMLEGVPPRILRMYCDLRLSLDAWLKDTSKEYPFRYSEEAVADHHAKAFGTE